MKKHRKKKRIIGRTSKRLNPVLDKVFGIWLVLLFNPEEEHQIRLAANELNMTIEEFIKMSLYRYVNERKAQL